MALLDGRRNVRFVYLKADQTSPGASPHTARAALFRSRAPRLAARRARRAARRADPYRRRRARAGTDSGRRAARVRRVNRINRRFPGRITPASRPRRRGTPLQRRASPTRSLSTSRRSRSSRQPSGATRAARRGAERNLDGCDARIAARIPAILQEPERRPVRDALRRRAHRDDGRQRRQHLVRPCAPWASERRHQRRFFAAADIRVADLHDQHAPWSSVRGPRLAQPGIDHRREGTHAVVVEVPAVDDVRVSADPIVGVGARRGETYGNVAESLTAVVSGTSRSG